MTPNPASEGVSGLGQAAVRMLGTVLGAVGLAGLIGVLVAIPGGRSAMVGALLGALLAALAFGTPLVIMKMASSWSPPAVMAAGLSGYLVITGALGVAFLVLNEATWISQRYLGWTLLAGTVAATAGLMLALRRLRLPIYDRVHPNQGAE